MLQSEINLEVVVVSEVPANSITKNSDTSYTFNYKINSSTYTAPLDFITINYDGYEGTAIGNTAVRVTEVNPDNTTGFTRIFYNLL